MEGKALLFKYLGGVDAVPLCVRTRDADDLVHIVKALVPSFGGVNLEDIAQPKCFRVLDALRGELDIPVWHDDQQGTATAVLAGLSNALKLVNKPLGNIKIAMVGMGAANVSTYRLLKAAGASASGIVACDSVGTLHAGRADIEDRQIEFPDKWRVCTETNPDRITGGIREALQGADVCLAFSRSGPGVIDPLWVKAMAANAIVFACANPVPEIWPWEALDAGARIAATGRSDFPNQVNNALVFPGIFRGVLDVRARTISDEMALAAAAALASTAERSGLREDRILPAIDDPEVPARVAVAAATMAERQGLAGLDLSADALHRRACQAIDTSHAAMRALLREGVIAQPPP
jgi:malate dehydrogenase (oxaloacetate-decarboxylating)